MEDILVKGDLTLKLYNPETGEVIREDVYHNLVVDTGKVQAIKLLFGDGGAAPVTKIGVGTSNTAASVSDTALTSAVIVNLLPGVTYAGSKGTVSYEFDTSTANGMTIREIGLYNTSNVLVSRKVLDTPIVKTSSFAITGTWALRMN